ncbi:class I fructose-bisphosphate aldolase [Marinobacter xestospongiae]|uniref:class I fructose-bisphosphate aldolase n=1 Tax=Marinobacter xestospongiae TaxID=994319 RepID=UPI0020043FCD|nr:class I fructose-bisphosphate aldolase [Marinobacter xestospongiae]MCK7566889.1 fructose-bisphosphate aldolase class I [Marinobacter xestospongiae]
MGIQQQRQDTIAALVAPGKGILAADESSPTIAKRFAAIAVESTEANRREYRSLLFATPRLGDSISGVILFEETLGQNDDDGTPLPQRLVQQGIVPGIKVDKGKGPLANAPGDEITRGLDGLEKRLEGYLQQGARFAKWRCVYHIGGHNPGPLAVKANAEVLASYAAICQSLGMVPIVEPEVLIDGDHDLERCAQVSETVLHEVFHALHRHRVELETMILKPSMVTPGKDHPQAATAEQVAEHTLRVFRRVVPAAVPGINFLSGGQGPEEATVNLNAINQASHRPWTLSFSYGRALQEPALAAWGGHHDQREAAQQALLHRARMNALATTGEYRTTLEAR